MAEPRKNHHTIDGGQVKEDDPVATYKSVPETDTDYRRSKSSLSKSKERLSADGAEEKLLQKEDEAKITTRVDLNMADAKYVVGDHRNGDAKIELDANKKQFSGLTKEELLKYADDPFWVRLRWFMFVLFWALWLGMLSGAIAIIVRAPKCAPPPAKTWFEIGPLADRSSDDYAKLESELPLLQTAKVQGVFITPCDDSYEILFDDTPTSTCIQQFKSFVEKAKKYSVKVIVDLTANFVSTSHKWFVQSENRSADFEDYFVWAVGKDSDPETGRPKVPNNWVSTKNEEAWTWNANRKEYYLHQYSVDQADLNFSNPAVVTRFDDVLRKWMAAGAAGVRLHKARQLLVNASLANEQLDSGRGSDLSASHKEYASLRHRQTSDQPQLDFLLAHWSHLVATASSEDTVFTLAEDGLLAIEWHRMDRNATILRPPSAARLSLTTDNARLAADSLSRSLTHWPAIQLSATDEGAAAEVALLAMLLPAAPVLGAGQPEPEGNDTSVADSFGHMAALRLDASIQHGHFAVVAVRANNSTDMLLACARWKSGHTGYAAVYNPTEMEASANLTSLQSLPATITVHHMSHQVRLYTNYTNNESLSSERVLVPPQSSLVLSYVPKTTAEQ